MRQESDVEQTIGQYADMVKHICFVYMKNESDTEDVFQDVFLKYALFSEPFQSEEHKKAWLIRVTVNCAKKFWSSAWIRHTVPLEEDLAFEQETDNRLWEELQNLPGKYRAVLHLFYYEELSAEEIGGLLGLQPSAVRMRLTRGRRMLRQRLEE